MDFENTISVDDLTPLELKGQVFDAKKAKQQMSSESIPDNSINLLLKDKNALRYREHQLNDESLEQADTIIEKFQGGVIEKVASSEDYTIEKCIQDDITYEIELNYALRVNVTYTPKTENTYKICQGHRSTKKYTWKSDAERAVKDQKKKFEADETIKSYKVKISNGSFVNSYEVKSEWTHKNNVDKCNKSKTKTLGSTKERFDEEDQWILENLENEKIVLSSKCFLIGTELTNLNQTKSINDKNVFRSHWGKVQRYRCLQDTQRCKFLGSNLCNLIEKKYLREGDHGGSLWELIFRCQTNSNTGTLTLDTDSLIDCSDEEITNSPNTSFSETITKLKVFEEMEKELVKSGFSDLETLELFTGKKQQCSKSVAENLMYDCCGSLDGLTNDLKLSKCTTDELALAQMKEKGLCHYIGSYDEEFISLWKSRENHVYCCFPSKLIRVLQEEGRKQLGISWGTPEKPNCRGLTHEEIVKIDFLKIDLSEAYAIPPSVDMTDRINAIEDRLKMRIRDHAESQKNSFVDRKK